MSQVVIADSSGRSRGWSRVMLGTAVTLSAAVCAGARFRDGDLPGTTADRLWAVFAGGVLLIGVVTAVRGAVAVRRSHLFGVPTLTVPGSTVLPLGRVVVACFQRRPGGGHRLMLPDLTAALVCEETVTQDVGSMVRTSTRELRRHPLTVTLDERQDQDQGLVSARIRIEVPLDAPPSLDAHHSRVAWSVQVRTRVHGHRDDTCAFPVLVRPEVAPELLE